MAHEIWENRFIARGEPGWHNLGTVFPRDRAITVEQAVVEIGADYTIQTTPALTIWNDQLMIAGDSLHILRPPTADDPTPRIFGIAGPDYTPLQNIDLARMLDKRIAQEWKLETLGVLRMGATVFICLAAGDSEIGGEHIRDYFLVTDTRDGGTAARIFYTPTRVVCANTLAFGLARATSMVAIPHTRAVHAQVDYHIELMTSMRQARDQLRARLEQLTALKLTTQQAKKVFVDTYPYPGKPQKVQMMQHADGHVRQLRPDLAAQADAAERDYEATLQRVDALRTAAHDGFLQLSEEVPTLSLSGWLALNAVTDLSDHRTGGKPAAIAESALFGDRAKEKGRCFESLSKLLR